MLTMTDADDLVDDANDVSDADDDDDDDDDDDNDANMFLYLDEETPELSKWPRRLHLVSTFFLL